MKINSAKDVHIYIGTKTAPSDAGKIFPDRITTTNDASKQRSIEERLRLPIYRQGSRKPQMATNGFHQILVSHKISKVQLERFSQAIRKAKNLGDADNALLRAYLSLEESVEGEISEERKQDLKAKVSAIQQQLTRSHILRYTPFSLYGAAKRAARKALPSEKAERQSAYERNLVSLEVAKNRLEVATRALGESEEGTEAHVMFTNSINLHTSSITELNTKIESYSSRDQRKEEEELKAAQFYTYLNNAKEMRIFAPRFFALTLLIGSSPGIAGSKTQQRRAHEESQLKERLRISIEEERSISSASLSHLSRLLTPDSDRSPDIFPRQSSMSSQGSVEDHRAVAGPSASPLHSKMVRFTSMPHTSAAADDNSVAGTSAAPPLGTLLRQHSLPVRMTDLDSGAKRKYKYRFSDFLKKDENDRLAYLENLASERGINTKGSDPTASLPREVAEESATWLAAEIASVKPSLSPEPDLSKEKIDASIIAAYQHYRDSMKYKVDLTLDEIDDVRKWLNKTLEEGIAFLDGRSKDKNLPADAISPAAKALEVDGDSEAEDGGAGISSQRKKLAPSEIVHEKVEWTPTVHLHIDTFDYSSTHSADAGTDGNSTDK